MEPTSSLSQMFAIINKEGILKSYSTEQLVEILQSLQKEDLTKILDNHSNPILRCSIVSLSQ